RARRPAPRRAGRPAPPPPPPLQGGAPASTPPLCSSSWARASRGASGLGPRAAQRSRPRRPNATSEAVLRRFVTCAIRELMLVFIVFFLKASRSERAGKRVDRLPD